AWLAPGSVRWLPWPTRNADLLFPAQQGLEPPGTGPIDPVWRRLPPVHAVRGILDLRFVGHLHIVPTMPARRTIGVDMGGTKLLAGAVGAGLEVHHRAQRVLKGLDQQALLDAAVDAVEEARAAAGDEVAAVGFGIPSLMDQRTGTAV